MNAAAVAVPVAPPSSWFSNPNFSSLTPLTVTPEGRVYGHLAGWGSCHLDSPGFGGCVVAPRSSTNYAGFLLGTVLTEDGKTISTGPIVLATPHALPIWGPAEAMRHYSDTGAAVADVQVGEDRFGIWFAGALRPGVTPEQLRTLRASSLSGDWREHARTGSLELIAALAVNSPGFPIQRPTALVASSGIVASLVAVGTVAQPGHTAEGRDRIRRGLRVETLRRRVDALRAADSSKPSRNALSARVREFAARHRDDAPRHPSSGAPSGQRVGNRADPGGAPTSPPVAHFEAVLGIEGQTTGDGRLIEPGALTAGALPLPLRWVSADHGGHDGAVIVGKVDSIDRGSDGTLRARGVLDLGGAEGREAHRLIKAGLLSGVAIDLDQTATNEEFVTSRGRIRAATLVAIPTFDDARLTLLDDYDCGCSETVQITHGKA